MQYTNTTKNPIYTEENNYEGTHIQIVSLYTLSLIVLSVRMISFFFFLIIFVSEPQQGSTVSCMGKVCRIVSTTD